MRDCISADTEVSRAKPLKETLACSLLLLSYWRGERLLVDPLCGSGTIPIEAAMIALDIAPGMNRGFAAERWQNFDYDAFERARDEAKQRVRTDLNLNIYGSDIDPKAIELAMRHAEEAGVDDCIVFRNADIGSCLKRKIRLHRHQSPLRGKARRKP